MNAKSFSGQWVLFRLGEERFGVDIAAVREIMRVPRVTKLPATAPALLGVVNFRGAIAPVLDLRARLGLAAAPEDAASERAQERLLLVAHAGKTYALLVDAVEAVGSYNPEAIEPLAGVMREAETFISGVIKREQDVLLVLDLPGALGVAPEAAAPEEPVLESVEAPEQRAPVVYPLRAASVAPTETGSGAPAYRSAA